MSTPVALPHKNRPAFITTLRILLPLLCALWIAFVFYNSSRTGAASGGVSSHFTTTVNGYLQAWGWPFSISETFIRKLGHIAEYALLGMLMLCTLFAYTHRRLAALAWPLLAGVLVATADEFYQTFIPGRDGQPMDVLIDFGGILLGCLLAVLLLAVWRAILRRRAGRKTPVSGV